MSPLAPPIPSPARIEAFCREHGLLELSLFGSVLRDDFGPDSDIDVLIVLGPGRVMTIETHLAMTDELSALFGGRAVDLVQKRLLKNPYRRRDILSTRQIVYAA